MRPGHLNVFDGLRITTEHMNYLQGSFHSAVQDLRGILGLGAVFEGFEVTVEGNSVTVGPGLAFDYQKNRIILDQPVSVELNFAPGENTKYVCVKYDQIEDGEVEGRFTLVWDSCVVVLESALPDAADNLVPIARVDRINGNGAVAINKIGSVPSVKSPPPMAVRQGVLQLSNNATEASVSLDFELLSLTSQTIVTSKTEETSYTNPAHGEATFATEGVSQFGVAGSKFIEDGIACLPRKAADEIERLIKVSKSDGKGFIIRCEDQGEVSEWEALVAWKALGESRG